jgi:microcystin-dependent protein
VAPSGDAGNEIASTTYVQEAIANASGTLSLNTTGSYQWTGNYQVFNNNQIITIGDNLTVPPTLPESGETCLANQVGVQIENDVYDSNETDFLNYAGDKLGGFSFSTITDSYPLKQNLEITNNGSATILNVLGAGSDIQVNSLSVLVPDPASQSLPNTFTDSNTFEGTTILDGPLEINNPSTVTDVMTFEPNCIKLINPTYATGIGQVLLGPQGNIQLLNNQSTKGVTIQSGTYATSMLVDNLSNLNLRNGLVVTGNASANNITSANNISTATMTISGIATAPTAPATTNTDQLATCAFVLQNQSASTGAEVGFPNTFTATQTFQANTQYPTNIILSRESQIDEASIKYNNQVTTLTSPFTFNLSDGINTTVFKPLANGGCNNNGSAIINQTALNTALSAYPTSASLGTTFAQLSGATFTGDVITPSISATTGSINNSPIITSANITPALSGYAQLSSADFLGTVTAPTIRSTGAISCLSGTINGFPIVSSNNLTNALAGYVSKSVDDTNVINSSNTFYGYTAINNHLTVPPVASGGAGVQVYWNTSSGTGATDLLCVGEGGVGGLNIWACPDGGTPKQCAIFQPTSSNIYGTLNITNPTNPANTTQLKCDVGGTINVVGSVTANTFSTQVGGTSTFDGVSANSINIVNTATCPTVIVDDKYPTTDIVNATSLINYVNSQTATSQYFVGQLISGMFPSNSSELLGAGFLFCNGDPLDYTNPAYTALYNVIGINYGTSGGTIFYLPDFTGRMALGGNIEQGFGVPVPQFLDQDTTRNEQYNGVYGGYVGTGDFPSHYHTITDTGHSHSANINYARSNTGSNDTNILFNNQGGTPQQAFVSNNSFTGITQTNITGNTASIGVMNPYTAVNYFIYAGAP